MRKTLILLLLAADVAFACTCAGPPPPPCEFVELVPRIFLATATEVRGDGASSVQSAHLSVDEIFRGTLPGQIERYQYPFCESVSFQIGHQYVFYQSEDATKPMMVSPCSRDSDVQDSREDVRYLRDYAAGHATTHIRGNLDRDLDRFARSYKEYEQKRPMKNVTVQITGNGIDRRVKTNASGDYRVSGIAPGNYRIQISEPGFTREDLAVSIRPQGCAVRDFKLTADRHVHGTVRDENGHPVGGVNVSMKRADQELDFIEQQYLLTISKADGTFSFDGVWPGRYHLGANLDNEPYFYPGTSDRKAAKEIVFTKKTGSYEANFVLPAAQRR
ncbi:MAG: carboxypeptidase-like regulatory domain-containing protein [Bryobacteraceae bacterium]